MIKVRDIAPTGIRFPDHIKNLLKLVAKEEGRSVSNEVIKRIERSLMEDGLLTGRSALSVAHQNGEAQ
jgi:predicted DNA-binding protein